MSIITDIGKTVRSRIVGDWGEGQRGHGRVDKNAAVAAPIEPTKRPRRHPTRRVVGADNGEHAGPAQQIGQTFSRQALETAAVPEAATKSDTVLHLLRQPDGATLADLMAATSWQRHSVRGFLSGTVRKKLGLNLVSDITGGERRYRIRSDAKRDGSAPSNTVPIGPTSITDAVDAPTGTAVC